MVIEDTPGTCRCGEALTLLGLIDGAADRHHTLNTLDLTKEDGLSKNSTGDQLSADIFFRVNQSLQHFFDSSAKLETIFESEA